MNAGCFGASRRILLQMADLLFFWILYIVALESGKYLDFASEAAEPGMTVGGEPSPPE